MDGKGLLMCWLTEFFLVAFLAAGTAETLLRMPDACEELHGLCGYVCEGNQGVCLDVPARKLGSKG